MTGGNEITDVLVFEGNVPALPPQNTRARSACARATNARLRSSWFWGGGDASPALPRRKTTGNRPRACCCSPLRKRGAGAGPSGAKNKEEEAKGRLGRGRASLTRNETRSARMGLVPLFIQCTHGRLLTSLGIAQHFCWLTNEDPFYARA
jgi:hypothetical protein